MKFLTSHLRLKWSFSNSDMSYEHKSRTFVDTYIISKRVRLSGKPNHFLTRIVSKRGITQPETNISVFNISYKTTFLHIISILTSYVNIFVRKYSIFGSFALKWGLKYLKQLITLEVLRIVTKYTSLKIWLIEKS